MKRTNNDVDRRADPSYRRADLPPVAASSGGGVATLGIDPPAGVVEAA